MAYRISSFAGAGAQFFDDNGDPLSGGLLYTYTAGTTTPATTWTSISGAVANTNPIVLDSAGRTPNEIWLLTGVTYKFILKTSAGVTIGTYDNLPAVDDPTVFNNLITVTGTNTLIGTSNPPYTAYVPGMTLSFLPVATNTGAVTIDLDGLGAKNIYSDSSTPLGGGELVSGKITVIEYDGTRFQLTSAAAVGAGSITTTDLANGAVTAVKLATDAVETAKIADGAVTAAKLSSTAVTAANIADGSITAAKLSTGAPSWDTAGVFSYNSGYGSNAPVYGCRAWVNFNAVPATGTYTRSGTTISVTLTDHGMSTGQKVNMTFVGGATSGTYAVTVTGVNTFTVTDTVSGTITSNTATRNIWIRGSGNVSSITDNGTGNYTVNFTTAMPDANYAVVVTSYIQDENRFSCIYESPTTTSVVVLTQSNQTNTAYDATFNSVAVFR